MALTPRTTSSRPGRASALLCAYAAAALAVAADPARPPRHVVPQGSLACARPGREAVPPAAKRPLASRMRMLGVSVLIAAVVFLATAGHVLFLPLVILPLGLLTLGRGRAVERRRRF